MYITEVFCHFLLILPGPSALATRLLKSKISPSLVSRKLEGGLLFSFMNSLAFAGDMPFFGFPDVAATTRMLRGLPGFLSLVQKCLSLFEFVRRLLRVKFSWLADIETMIRKQEIPSENILHNLNKYCYKLLFGT